MMPGMIHWLRWYPGYLIIDDTNNAKYGLKRMAKKLFYHGTGECREGYKIVLFLWVLSDGRRFPIGFALYHRGSPSCSELALDGLSQLRNRFKLKFLGVLADGAYSTDELVKRLTDYGWPLVMRTRNDRLLTGKPIKIQIARGYGEVTGTLKNGTKVKIVRAKKHFLVCNRMMLKSSFIRGLYRLRWKIEEVFRAVKSCIGLSSCQQHSMQAQTVYVLLCFLLFNCLEYVSAGSPYQVWRSVNFGHVGLKTLLNQEFLAM
jgi:hypothetical protein